MFHKIDRIWIYSFLLATGSILLFVGGPDYYSSRSFKYLWDTGHIIYFALLAGLLSRWRFIARMSLTRQWAIILLITLLAGVSIEFMQYGTQRTPDTGDVLRDLTGCLLGLVFSSSRSASQPVSWRLPLQVSVLALLLVQLWPLTKALTDEAISSQQFPILSDFETPFEIERWAGNARQSVVSMPSISRGKLLKLSLTTDKYSGVALNHFEANWTSFRTLKISFYNPDAAPLEIAFRIHDLQYTDGNQEYDDRFRRRFLLMQGWNHIQIDLAEVEAGPADRSMDMSRIFELGFFVESLPEPRLIYLDNVELSP